MNTLFLLLARYEARTLIPVEELCRDWFSHLSPDKFLRKVAAGEIELPVVRLERSQKAARGVDVRDLAAYLDRQRAAAQKECVQLHRR